MEINVSLSDSEAEHLTKLAAEWRVEPEEAARTAIRSQFSAFRDLRYRPTSKLDVHDATELLLHAVWNADGTFTLLRNGDDPSADRIQQLSDALNVLWFHYRDQDSIPTSISHAAASIIHFYVDVRQMWKRDEMELMRYDLNLRAFELLSGGIADSHYN